MIFFLKIVDLTDKPIEYKKYATTFLDHLSSSRPSSSLLVVNSPYDDGGGLYSLVVLFMLPMTGWMMARSSNNNYIFQDVYSTMERCNCNVPTWPTYLHGTSRS